MTKIEPSSGNVFQDLGLENADELLEKAKIAIEIRRATDNFNGWLDKSFDRFTIGELALILEIVNDLDEGVKSIRRRLDDES